MIRLQLFLNQGRQTLACAPTGSGKTAAFLLPIIHHLGGPQKKGFRAVILSPTRELAKQTYRECLRLSEGCNFRVHIISKINQALNRYGSKSSQKFGWLMYMKKCTKKNTIPMLFFYISIYIRRYTHYYTKEGNIPTESGPASYFV